MEIDVENWDLIGDLIHVDMMNEDNCFEQRLIPVYGDFEKFVHDEGWLLGDVHFDQVSGETKEYPVSFEYFIEHSLNKNHVEKYLNRKRI